MARPLKVAPKFCGWYRVAMMLEDAERLAHRLLAAHGLEDWRFDFDHARVRLGACHFAQRRISLSRHLVALNSVDEVRETLLHEIAHALTGPGHGHDAVWREMARRVGARPRACAGSEVSLPQPPWQLVCQHCCRVLAHRHRRVLNLQRVACAQCGPELGRLDWRRRA